MRLSFALLGLLAIAGCGDSPTTPDPVTPTTVSEQYSGIASSNGTTFYSFTVGTSGPASVMLATVAGDNGLPIGRALKIGVGTPAGLGCGVETSMTMTAALVAQLSTTLTAGIHCVDVTDPSGASTPAHFNVRIVHQ